MIPRSLAARAGDAVAGLFLLGASLLYHLPALVAGMIPMQDDVRIFYFPLLVATTDALRQGTLPLWSPGIFGGYPLFADGEGGMLYPLHLLTLSWLAPEASLVVLRVIHSFLAGLFTFMLARTLRTGRIGAVIAGLVYAYSGFAAGQIVHSSIFEAMVWLPLALAYTERALRSRGRQCLQLALLAGAVVGIQALAVHVQVTIMTGLAISAFAAYRGPSRGDANSYGRPPSLPGRLLRSAAVVAIVGTLGIALGAIQLAPLIELGTSTSRGGNGLGPSIGATNSLWPGEIVTLFLPNLHDTGVDGFWGPWVKWETVIYVGVLPLFLAALALVVRSGPYRAFFSVLAALSLLLVLGANGPLWGAVHQLPGFGALRSPGRFSLWFALSIAVLAGYGADWLASRWVPRPRLALALLSLGSLLTAGVGVGLQQASDRVLSLAHQAGLILDLYALLPGMPRVVDGQPLTGPRVGELASQSLTPSNPATAWQLALLGACIVVIGVALVGGRARVPSLAMGTGLIFADLWMLGLTFHPYAPIAELRPRVPSVLVRPDDGPFRVYTPPTSDERLGQVEPNRLISVGVQDANGYTSLEPDRHAAYVNAVQYTDGDLMDLWNVRYVIRRVGPRPLPSYAGTSFHPERPLLSAKRLTPGSGEGFLPDGGAAEANQIRVVATMWDAAAVPDGTIIARIVLEAADGQLREVSLRAGRDISDTDSDRLGAQSRIQNGAEVAFQHQSADPSASRYGEQLYLGRLSIDPPMTVKRVTIEQMAFPGGLQVFGLGVVDGATGEVTQVRDKAKYNLVYSDSEIRVYENTQAMPRAFVVGTGVAAPADRDILWWMVDGPFDPRTTAIIEGPIPSERRLPNNGSVPINAEATLLKYRPEEVSVRATADRDALLVLTDPMYPGWVADVDGRPAPMLLADYLFRAVQIPAGTHVVTFHFQPWSLAAGAMLSALGFLSLAIIPLASLFPLLWRVAAPAGRLRSLAPRREAPSDVLAEAP